MASKYDIVIIGGGLGGLLTGNILSREGLSVCVVEQAKKVGGCVQSFAKNKTIFNTGLNYTESLGEGEILNQYFKYFKILDKLKLKQLDLNHFNKVSFSDNPLEYPFAQGHDNFIEQLSPYFRNSKKSLKEYIGTLKNICNSFPLYTLDNSSKEPMNTDFLHLNTYNYLKTVHPDKKLQNVLAGMNTLYGGVASKTPLYIHALINYTFIKSAWRIVDGSSKLATSIASVIKENGGDILLSSRVKKIGGENKQVKYVELENGEKIFSDKIISNIHPSSTLNLVEEKLSKKIYKTRISSLQNTTGMFTVYMVMKDKQFPYLNHNHHYYASESAWNTNYNEKSWPNHYFMYTPINSYSNKWANGVIAMTYMNYDEVKQWENSFVENRGEEYLEFKRKKSELLIQSVEKKFPKIRESIKTYYSSTPLTYRDYTGTPEGSSYGILKDSNDPLSTIITPKSRINGLYFTGQNLNLHGILGVTVSAVLTASEIVGQDYLINKIR